MRVLILITTALFSGIVFAEQELEVRVNRIEMAATAPDEPQDEAEDASVKRKAAARKKSVAKRKATARTRAQDYNSSRSNKESRAALAEGGDYNSSRSNKTHALDTDDDDDSIPTETCANGVDDDCDGAVDESPANHNTTRSNRTSS